MQCDEDSRLRSLIENAPFPIALRDLAGRFQVINRRGAEMIGRPAAELLGHTPEELFTHSTGTAMEAQAKGIRATGKASTYELGGSAPDGIMRDYLVADYPVLDDSGRLIGVGGISLDISERKAVENLLREAEDRFRGAFDSAAIGMALVTPDGRFVQVNAALCGILGFTQEQLLGVSFQEITHPDDLDADLELVRQLLEGEIQSYQMDKRYRRNNGETIWSRLSVSLVRDAKGEPLHFVSQIEDISQQKLAEELAEQLRHSQKLDALGRLAGGIAHDFNNMLTAIQGYSQLLLDGLAPDDGLRHNAEQISRAAEQASALPKQLLAFSRKQTVQATTIDLNEVTREAGDMLSRLVSDTVELVVEAADGGALAVIDPAQVEQVLVNLVVNASEAMPSGGTLRISTRNDYLASVPPSEPDAVTGPHVVISVADDGVGMDSETKSRIFEPFFTTKATGSGLGLATVYGIVRHSNGLLRVRTAPGRGSTFEVWLPRSLADPAAGPNPRLHRDEATPPTALIAEDEDVVRDLACTVLKRAGYRVLAATCGEHALELAEDTHEQIDVLVADMVMPGMSGLELASELQIARPGTAVVFMSGYSEQPPLLEHAAARPPLFLPKPFAPAALIKAVREALRPAVVRSPQSPPPGGEGGVTCVLADDHPAVLDSVSQYLQAHGIRVLGQVSRGDEALALIERERPTIALLDVRMAPLSGIEVTRQISARVPECQVVLFTGYGDRAILGQALDAGARGFVLKEAALSELIRAITEVACGGTYVSPALEESLTSSSTVSELSPLSNREHQVLALVADGMTNDKAAGALGISAETVQSHVRNAMSKLDADNRTQAVATALRRSLLA
jgi:two-component system, cell cycle sensor histidine kinase and response regulator CckA